MKKLFKLAAIGALSIAMLASCDKIAKPDEEYVGNYWVLNGVKTEIVRCSLADYGDGNFELYFYDADENSIYVGFNKSKHLGKDIDLTVPDTNDEYFEWEICFYDAEFYGGEVELLCKSGVLRLEEHKEFVSYKAWIRNLKGKDTNENDVTFQLHFDGEVVYDVEE